MKEVGHKLTLDRPAIYQVKIPGKLDDTWRDLIPGMTITVDSDCEHPPVTTLTGTFDQAALHGLLRRLYSIGLPLLSVVWVEQGADKCYS